MDSSWNSFSQFSRNWTKSKLIRLVRKRKPMWPCKYFLILESKVKFDKTYLKMSKYENSLFPYAFQITVNLPVWKLKNTNVTLISFLSLFTEPITLERKSFFSKLHNKYCQNWKNPWGIVTYHENQNFSFRNFLLRYEPCIKNKEFVSWKGTKKNFHVKCFHKFLTKGNS